MPPENIPFVDLRPLHDSVRHEITHAMERVMTASQFICGPELEAFEGEFARYCEVQHCVGVSNGFDALVLILRAMDIGDGDEVILPANSFIATALAVSAAGAKPVLVDVDARTYNIDVAGIERAITPRTRAIIPVHLFGQMADMEGVMALAHPRRIKVIEDAAQAHGARDRGRRAGSIGHASAFSFYPGKNLGALGDGGAVVTDDPALAARVRLLRGYGSDVKYHHRVRGVNARLDELQAAFLRVKLRHLDDWNRERRAIAAAFERLLDSPALLNPFVPRGNEPVWHLYVVRLKDREERRQALTAAGVQTQIHYPVPIHLQEAYADLGFREGSFPVSELLAGEILSLPVWIGMNAEEVGERINETLTAGSAIGPY